MSLDVINANLYGNRAAVITEEAARTGLPLSLACALVEQESNGRNVMGCDHGSVGDQPPYCGQAVTKERVKKLIASPHMNGIGLTQLTWYTFVEDAERLGGAHIPRYQCRVGFALLADYLRRYPYLEALGAYNAGEKNRRDVLGGYAAQLAAKHDRWKQLLGEDAEDEMTNFDRGIDYLKPAIGRAPYWYWPPNMDIVPARAGAFAANWPVPPIREVISGGLFCAAVVNLIRRANRKVVPYRPSLSGDARYWYDGGTWACQEFWREFRRPFDRWAVYPRGTLIGRFYTQERVNCGDQGHVAVLLGEQNLRQQKDPLILHSHPQVGGLARTRLGVSHAGWYYEYAVAPEDWVNHGLSKF